MTHSARATVELPKTELLREYLDQMAKVPPAGSASRPGWYPLVPVKALFLIGNTEDITLRDGQTRRSTPILKSIFNGLEKGTTVRMAEVIVAEL